MRVALLAALAVFPILSTFALPNTQGRIIQGAYTASGRASVAGVTVTYLPSKVHLNEHGKVVGFVNRIVTNRAGTVLESGGVRIRGNCRSLRIKHGTFTAPAVIHTSDGAVIRGEFHGLTSPSQKLSRFFKGKISGSGGSNFKLQAR